VVGIIDESAEGGAMGGEFTVGDGAEGGHGGGEG